MIDVTYCMLKYIQQIKFKLLSYEMFFTHNNDVNRKYM